MEKDKTSTILSVIGRIENDCKLNVEVKLVEVHQHLQ